MMLTPGIAKLIAEKIIGTEPVFSTRGERKGEHIKYAYRFVHYGKLDRHISIVRSQKEEGVTVYVNKISVNGIVFPKEKLNNVRVKEEYPKGSHGKEGNKGLSTAAGGLPTLDPTDNDVMRLSVSTEEAFRGLIGWYFGNQLDDKNESKSFEQKSLLSQAPSKSLVSETSAASEDNTLPQQQETGGDGLNSAISPSAQKELDNDTNLTTSEREAVVKVRYGQGEFREALFKEDGEKCWMSGIDGRKLLVASHIKPWSHCKEDIESRGKPENGLLLSSLWDAAFDVGLISFDEDWQVITSTELSLSAKKALNLDQHKALPEKFRKLGRRKFLEYHRAEVFEYWKKAEYSKRDKP